MKAVAIVGMAESTRHLAPWDEGCEIWVMNETGGETGLSWVKRWDRTFQMHKPFDYRRANNQNDPKHWEWLKQQTKPVYMQDTDPDVPGSVKYPKDEIIARYLGNYGRQGTEGPPEYFRSSAAYMVALAGYEGFDHIGIYGIEMAFESEYRDQRPNFEFWLGVVGQHAKVVVPASCSLLGGAKGMRYGYDQVPSLNPTQFGIRRMAMEKSREEILEQAQRLKGEAETAEKQAKAFSGDAVRAKALREKATKAEAEVDQLVAKVNVLTGHIDEARFILDTIGQLNDALREWTPEIPE